MQSIEKNIANYPEKIQPEKKMIEKSLECKSEICNPKSAKIEDVKNEIVELGKLNWGEEILDDPDFTPEVIEKIIKDPKNTTVLLRTFAGKIIGYSIATPDEDSQESAYIYSTDIHPSFQGKKLVGKIMLAMEDELKKRGYLFMTRDSAVENGYADSIERNYEDRIISKSDHDSKYGMQRYFKIKL